MELIEYQKLAVRTDGQTDKMRRIVNCAFGLIGELGEVFELLKKHYFHGHDLELEKLKKEIGDVLWYTVCLADTFGLNMNEIAEMNIAKLKSRYPERFEIELSRNRVE